MRACTSQVDRERRESFRVNSSAGARRLVFLTGDTSVCAQHAPLTAPHTRRRIELEGFGGQPGHKPRPSCWLRCGNAIVALPRGDQWRGLGHTLAACARRQNPCCRDWRSFGRRSVRAASATQRLGLCLTVPARWPAGMLGPCILWQFALALCRAASSSARPSCRRQVVGCWIASQTAARKRNNWRSARDDARWRAGWQL